MRTWNTRHAGPAWIHNASFSVLLSEAPWSRNSCHNACSAWASLKWAGGALACSRSYPGRAVMPSGAGRAARDDEASTPCVGCCSITQPSSRITSTPAVGSGAGAGQFPHWPHPSGGASSSSGIARRRRAPSGPWRP
jgi:hypothetical protein